MSEQATEHKSDVTPVLKSPRITTTVIGSYPSSAPLKDGAIAVTKNPFSKIFEGFDKLRAEHTKEELDAVYTKAIREVIDAQVKAGVDVITDGEVARENYVHYHCRHLKGISFDTLTEGPTRNARAVKAMPTIVGTVEAGEPFLVDDWKRAQDLTDTVVKVTIPGPHCILDTVTDKFYLDREKACRDIAKAVNVEVLRLIEAGVTHIQLDEPAFSREPKETVDWGAACVNEAVKGVDLDKVHVQVHVCYGYPDECYNDEVNPEESSFQLAQRRAYHDIAPALNECHISSVSVEDAHWPQDLTFLESYTKIQVCLGVVGCARRKAETVEKIKSRVKMALKFIPPQRLLLAPDCGLIMLSPKEASDKLTNMVQAARELNAELGLV